MFEWISTSLINLLSTWIWHKGSTPLSNLYAASDLILYLVAFPIIASGSKYAHSTITDFVFDEHDVFLPPTIPAKLIILLSIEKIRFCSSNSISLPNKFIKLPPLALLSSMMVPSIF